MKIYEQIKQGAEQLNAAGIESSRLDARLLMQHVLQCSREALLLREEQTLLSEQQEAYFQLLEKRIAYQPISQITGKREFWGLEFYVTEDTLDPRPNSETLIEAVLRLRPEKSTHHNLLDLGTGTGCLLLSLLREYSQAGGVGVDKSKKALAVAKQNAYHLGLDKRVQWLNSNWTDGISQMFDIVITNPPYIPTETIKTLSADVRDHEPRLAIDGGKDGLDAYRLLAKQVPGVLKPGGLLAMECGVGQAEDIAAMFEIAGMQVNAIEQDLAGIDRVVVLTR
jgi:release factor glutamine methyltransferase